LQTGGEAKTSNNLGCIHLLLQGRKEKGFVSSMYLYILWRKGNLSIFDFEKPRQNGLTTKEMETCRHFLLIFVRNSFIFSPIENSIREN
jgi:hypothetical protein